MKQLFSLLFLVTLFVTDALAQCGISNERILYAPGTSLNLTDVKFRRDGTVVTGGVTYSTPAQGAIATLMDNNSVFGQLHTYSGIWIKKVAVAPNNDVYAVGWSFTEQSSTALLVMRLSPTGDIHWVKRLQDNFSPDTWTVFRVEPASALATSDGGVVICGAKEYKQPGVNSYKYRSFVLKLDDSGNLKWTREDTNNSHDEHWDVEEKNGRIYVAGTTSRLQDGISYGTLMQLESQSGALLSLKGYHLNDVRSNTFRDIDTTNYGFLVGAQAYTTNGFKHGYYVIKLDHVGNVLAQKQLNFAGSSSSDAYYEVSPTPDGGCLVWLTDNLKSFPGQEARLYKLDNNLDVEWKRYYTSPPSKPGTTIYGAWPEAGAYKALGRSADPDAANGTLYTRLFSIDNNGRLSGCTTADDNMDIKDSLTYNSRNISWMNTYTMNFVAPFSTVISKNTLGTTKKILCTSTSCNIQDFTIIGDTVICGTEATLLKAKRQGDCPADFTWEVDPAFADILPVNDTSVQLHIKKEGAAMLTVKWKGTCNTLEKKIKLIAAAKQPIKPDLGRDTSICNGNTVELALTHSYKDILWSDNTRGQKISVTKAGTYWVKVTDDNTCFVADTMIIHQVYPSPTVTIKENATLCLPDPLVLKAGGADLTYLWQDGSKGNEYTVTSPGVYWVKATNSFGCTMADTLQISASYQKPSAFLSFTDSAACIGQQIELSVNQTFKSYNWNNGASTSSTYRIYKPGVYPVTVTDFNGCTAIESILIRDKGCIKAIHFPNAFHPAGINKIFRPLIQGAIPETIHLAIYNRWGELIFESKEADKGWDGTFKNRQQGGELFIWICRYRFPGEAEQIAKGTVMLIR